MKTLDIVTGTAQQEDTGSNDVRNLLKKKITFQKLL